MFTWPKGPRVAWVVALCIPSAASAAADLFMEDTPSDTGVEPNPDPGPMWRTQDIWVRTEPDPGFRPDPFPAATPSWPPLPNENPEYRDPKYSRPNYVYVRIRNRGDAASSGMERLTLHWAKAAGGLAWPTQFVDYLATTCGPRKLYGAEVTKPRKNAATASGAERAAYRDAILAIGANTPPLAFPDRSYWHKQDEVHEFGPANRHGSPAFTPWHREFINRYEILLQEADPTVKLLYWDWTTNPSTAPSNFFTSNFMGLPFPGLAPPTVTRNVVGSPPAAADSTILGQPSYELFRPANETAPNHDASHPYIGGNMRDVPTAAEDPFFFLLHGNADRLWARWQRTGTVQRLDPAMTYGTQTTVSDITTSMAPWNGAGVSIRPWTTADGYIVSKNARDPSVVFPPIYDTAPLVIPILQPGQAVVIEIPWYPPNPADFAGCGVDQGHVCLVARIETATGFPFGMSSPEGADLSANTRNNNNIAWKNITVVDEFAGALRRTSILVRNIAAQPAMAGLAFVAERAEGGGTFLDFGRILVDLGPELFERWVQGEGTGFGIEPAGENSIEVHSPEAVIQGIRLEPQETFPVEVRFELPRGYRSPQGRVPVWHLLQLGTPGDPGAVMGGQTFEVDFNKLVLVKSGAEWRYLDDGTYPGPGWMDVGFDDAGWRHGRGELGFGDDPATTIDGGPARHRFITTYFRHTFEVEDPSFLQSVLLRLKRDDGAVVYLNGSEIHRVNLPEHGAVRSTRATRPVRGLEEEVFFPVTVPVELVRAGPNTVAVEVHQHSPRSSDLSFDLELSANRVVDHFPPDVAFSPSTDGALYQRGRPVEVEVEALDSDGKVASVSLYADGAPVGTAGEPSHRSPSEEPRFRFLLKDAALGLHRLRAVAVDDERQQAISDVTVSVLDNVPPAVALTRPEDRAVFARGQRIRLAATASDPFDGIRRVEFFLRKGTRFDAPDELVGAATSPPYELTLQDLEPDQYKITARATDGRGATEQSSPVLLEVTP